MPLQSFKDSLFTSFTLMCFNHDNNENDITTFTVLRITMQYQCCRICNKILTECSLNRELGHFSWQAWNVVYIDQNKKSKTFLTVHNSYTNDTATTKTMCFRKCCIACLESDLSPNMCFIGMNCCLRRWSGLWFMSFLKVSVNYWF